MTKTEITEDLKLNDNVRFVTETESFDGTILKFDESTIKIRRLDSGNPKRFNYETIRDFEILNNTIIQKVDNSNTEKIAKEENCEVESNYITKNIDTVSKAIENAIPEYYKPLEKQNVDLKFETIYKTVNSKLSPEEQNEISAVKSILLNAKQIHEDGFENSKIRKVFKKLDLLIEDGIYEINSLKAALQFEYGKKESIDSFLSGKDYNYAFYASEEFLNEEKQLEAAILATNFKQTDDNILLWLLKYAKKNNRLDLMDLLLNNTILEKSVLLYYYADSSIILDLPNKEDIKSEENINYLVKLFESTEIDKSIILSLLEQYKEESSVSENNEDFINYKTGKITYFHNTQYWGFINQNHYFYIKQISDENLQSILLKYGVVVGKDLHVRYKLGRNKDGRIAADDIQLIEDIKINADDFVEVEGSIIDYNPFNDYGIIRKDNKTYKFYSSEISDKILAKILDFKTDKLPISVFFKRKPIYNGRTIVATEVRPLNQYSQLKIDDLLNRKIITKSDLYQNQSINTKSKDYICSFAYEPLIPIEVPQIKMSSDSFLPELNNDTYYSNLPDYQYFELGRQAETYEKNLDKAIKYYKTAIAQNQNLSSAVLNLALIYSRLDMKAEALELLNEYRDSLDSTRYLNTTIAVLSKNIDSKYKNELLNAFQKLIESTYEYDKLVKNKIAYARSLYCLDEFEESEKLCNKILTEKIDESQRKFTLRILCNINLKQNKIEKAINYAKLIIKITPSDSFALSVIDNSYTDETLEPDEQDFTDGSRLSQFILDKVENLQLLSQLKNTNMISKSNEFIGSEEHADKIIKAIWENERTVGNYRQRADNRFTIALLTKQIIDRSNDKHNLIRNLDRFNENAYFDNIAFGALYLGTSRLYNEEIPKNTDTARFCYIEAAKVYKTYEKNHPCWYSATLSYFMTFFTPELEYVKKVQYQKFTETTPTFEKKLIEIINGNKLEIPNFVIGLFNYIENIEKERKTILKIVFNSKHKQLIIDFLKNTFNYEYDDDIELFNKCLEKYMQERKTFYNVITALISNIFSISTLIENNEIIKNSVFMNLLNVTDHMIIDKFLRIIESIMRYNESPDFDTKFDILKDVEDKRQDIVDQIRNSTTKFGFEFMDKNMEILYGKILKESQSLFGNSVPELKVSFVDSTVTSKDNSTTVDIVVRVTNKPNVQAADNATISISSPKATVVNSSGLARLLISGNSVSNEQNEYSWKLKLKQDITKDNILPVSVTIDYQYKKNINDTENGSIKQDLSVPLEDIKFEPIDNRFNEYQDGGVVNDKEMFFGRDKDIEDIIQSIFSNNGRVKTGKSLALYGQTRTGKSSLLYHLKNKLQEMKPNNNIIIDLGSIGEMNLKDVGIEESNRDRLFGFFATIIGKLKTELQENHPELYQEVLAKEIDLNPRNLDRVLVQTEFQQIMSDIDRIIENRYSMILMIDEFTYIYDWIRQKEMTDRFMKLWKALIQNHNIFAIIIGQDHMMQFVNDTRFTNDFGTTLKKKITYLSEKDAMELMNKPIMYRHNGIVESRFKEGALNRLYELTSGSAFLIMKLCAGIVDYINSEVHSPYITTAYINDYLKKSISTFEESNFFESQYIDRSTSNIEEVAEKNKTMLKRIAQESARKEWASCERIIKTQEDKEILQKLEARDVVIVEEEKKCKIKVALYKEWIISKYGR